MNAFVKFIKNIGAIIVNADASEKPRCDTKISLLSAAEYSGVAGAPEFQVGPGGWSR
jgi:hypothetical protein